MSLELIRVDFLQQISFKLIESLVVLLQQALQVLKLLGVVPFVLSELLFVLLKFTSSSSLG
jgi:hypothetical protein